MITGRLGGLEDNKSSLYLFFVEREKGNGHSNEMLMSIKQNKIKFELTMKLNNYKSM